MARVKGPPSAIVPGPGGGHTADLWDSAQGHGGLGPQASPRRQFLFYPVAWCPKCPLRLSLSNKPRLPPLSIPAPWLVLPPTAANAFLRRPRLLGEAQPGPPPPVWPVPWGLRLPHGWLGHGWPSPQQCFPGKPNSTAVSRPSSHSHSGQWGLCDKKQLPARPRGSPGTRLAFFVCLR